MQLPAGDRYTPELRSHLERLEEQGYEIKVRKNAWQSANRFYGYKTTMISPHDPQRFEIKFTTENAWKASEETHQWYQQFRRTELPVQYRVHALLTQFAINEKYKLDDEIPPGLEEYTSSDANGLGPWIRERGKDWDAYREWLEDTGRDISAIFAEFGLNSSKYLPNATG